MEKETYNVVLTQNRQVKSQDLETRITVAKFSTFRTTNLRRLAHGIANQFDYLIKRTKNPRSIASKLSTNKPFDLAILENNIELCNSKHFIEPLGMKPLKLKNHREFRAFLIAMLESTAEELNAESRKAEVNEKADADHLDIQPAPNLTERTTQIKARIGQVFFRNGLKDIWKDGCPVSGVNELQLLIASHIKPWAKSTDTERIDINNGLLLSPNVDSLFDKGFISFNQKGHLIKSPKITEETYNAMGIPDSIRIDFNQRTRQYLIWHEANVFLSR